MTQTRNKNILQFLVHFTAWGMVFGLPFLIFWKFNDHDIVDKLIHNSVVLLSLIIVFYFNYFVLIERFLFRRKTGKFLLYNVLLIFAVGLSVHLFQESHLQLMPHDIKGSQLVMPSPISFLFRDIISLIFTTGLSIAVRMTVQWYKTEGERQEEEKKRSQAELINLRQQLNPHFLFNTLNNIYAQIAIKPEEAQNSMLELSKLLRYVLYENDGNFVPLERELNFIHNYVELMRIRLNPDVNMKINIDIFEKEKTVAPLLFITLIENAFKHGISPTKPSFINIDIHQNNDKQLNCTIKNSYFPKDESDQSGSGIGLENLSRRLEILYPHKHILRTEKMGDTFVAELIIPLNNSSEL
jgi:sensor histidine kinase YesM